MVFPVVGGTQDTSYEISNSLRFNDDDNAHLSRTVGTPTNEKIYTISVWVKKGSAGVANTLMGSPAEGDKFSLGDRIEFFTNGSADSYLRTNRLTRDSSAFYHLVIAYDTTQSTAANRVKLYINGEQYTWDLSTTFPSEDNTNGKINKSGTTLYIGKGHSGKGDGYFADFNFIDGQALAPTEFGETNDNGVWIPKAYTGTYGNNGFFLEFQQTGTSANSSGMGADTSGNDNHFAVNNLAATDVTTDTPTNNFATLNPVSNFHCGATYAEGNTRLISDESKYGFNCSSIGVANGKWYAEFKPISKDGESGNWYMVGVAAGEQTGHRLALGRDTGRTTSTRNGGIGWIGYGTNFVYQNDAYYDGDSNAYSTAAYTEDDILGVALNADDNQVTFYKNGTVQNSGTAFVLGTSDTGLWHFACGHFDTGNTFTIDVNFGNPSYANSSGNADANGYGDFEYAPPSGYYALCTKNLAEYG